VEAQTTSIELSVPSKLGHEVVARQLVGWLGRRLGWDGARVADVQTAVSEACINAIEHGNLGIPDCRVIVAFLCQQSYLDVIVSDEGRQPYHFNGAAPASIEQKMAGLASPRGMGLMLMAQLVDEAGFLPTQPGGGNRYRLRVYCDRPATPRQQPA
jgi:serine/threonine-protein kinase RsbW